MRAKTMLAMLVAALGLAAAPAWAATININGDITASATWTADNEYVLTGVRHVRDGATLTIEPGTVVRGEPSTKQCLVTGVACTLDTDCSAVTPGDLCVDDPGTLVVTRGAKIKAVGTPQLPIVFTNLDDDNLFANSEPSGAGLYANKDDARGIEGTWGGLILLGRGYVANATAAGPSPAKEVQIEGLQTRGFCTGLPTQQCANDGQCGVNAPCSFTRGFYGNCAASPLSATACDDDDSGSLQYVSIRYGGFNLNANNEINGLTLGGVGRATDVDYVEVFQNQDDGIEMFGGAVNLKHTVIAFGGDDSLDWDEGWRGKVQFLLTVHGVPGDEKNDKGGEWDGGNGPDTSLPMTIPTVYNATLIGHGGNGSAVAGADDPVKAYTGKATNTAMQFRDATGGRVYNSFIANFGGSALMIEGALGNATAAGTSGNRAITDYVPNTGNCSVTTATACDDNGDCPGGESCVFHYLGPDSAFQLELEDNSFWCLGGGSVLPQTPAEGTAAGGENKNYYDNGTFTNAALDNTYGNCATALPIRLLDRGVNPDSTKPDWIDEFDPRPAAGSVLLTTNRVPPADGFFEPAAYRGAFGDRNWAEGWTNLSNLGYFPARPTVNVNGDITASATWTADNEYVLTGVRHVRDGATLTIEPGTVVRGEPSTKQCLVTGVACTLDTDCSAVTPGDLCVDDPGTLVVTRGAKIVANGTYESPIVFTNLDDDNVRQSLGKASGLYANKDDARGIEGTWGGLILLGRGYVANATAAGPSPAKEVQIEGLQTRGFCTGLPTQQCANDGQCGVNAPCSFTRGFYGNCAASPLSATACDDDDSGSLQYVSIRYGGFNLNANNEINGLTLGGVGRATDVDYVEVFQNQDDGIEMFGGAVNLKHTVIAFGGDDSLDWDEGWRGKVQFLLTVHGVPGDEKNDKGGEWDGGNGPDTSLPMTIPTVYNATLIGHGGNGSAVAGADDPVKAYTGKATNTAMQFRDATGGRVYNSFIANFGGSALMIEGALGNATAAGTSGNRAITDYVPNTGNCSVTTATACDDNGDCPGGESCVFHYLGPDSAFQLELEDNYFWCIGGGSVLPQTPAEGTAAGGENKNYYDNGTFTNAALDNTYGNCATALPIRLLDRGVNPDSTKPDWIDEFDPVPAAGSVLLTSNRMPPADGFFESSQGFFSTTANYKGAFRDYNWAAWTNTSRLGYFFAGRPACARRAVSEVENLRFTNKTTLSWNSARPAGPMLYDTLRSATASSFAAATFLETDGPDTTAADATIPSTGSVLFYLVRAGNGCGEGTGGYSYRPTVERTLP